MTTGQLCVTCSYWVATDGSQCEACAAGRGTDVHIIDIVFDGPPGPNTDGHHCNFVEVETIEGRSIRVGEWIDRGDGLWALRLDARIKPRLDMNRISRCHHNFGWHVDMAGPCFDTHEQAIAYRDQETSK